MLTPEVFTTIAVALGSGGLGAVFVKFLERNDRREVGEIERLREDISGAKDAQEKCEERNEALTKQVRDMDARLRAVEASAPSYLARWVKDQNKRLLWLNDRAYLTMFAPLGWSREAVLDKTFEQLLGDGANAAIQLIEEIDKQALRHPNEVQSLMVQLHPDLPTMMIVKVAFAAEDGMLRFEGSSFVPSQFSHDMGPVRQARQRHRAAEKMLDREQGAE